MKCNELRSCLQKGVVQPGGTTPVSVLAWGQGIREDGYNGDDFTRNICVGNNGNNPVYFLCLLTSTARKTSLLQQLKVKQQLTEKTFAEIHNGPMQTLAFLIREVEIHEVPQQELLEYLRDVYHSILVGVENLNDSKNQRFCDVDEDFALFEDDLEGWRKGHQQYFERNGGFDNEMVLVCERFKVVEVL